MSEWRFLMEWLAVRGNNEDHFVKLDGDNVVVGCVAASSEDNYATETKIPKAVFLRLLGAEAFNSGFLAAQSANMKLAMANEAGLLACLAALSDETRGKLFEKMHELYCRHCGGQFTERHPVCHCENDE